MNERSRSVKWRGAAGNRQWHYGIVLSEATDRDPDGPYVEVEYTHSTPRLSLPAGRIIRIYSVHKVIDL